MVTVIATHRRVILAILFAAAGAVSQGHAQVDDPRNGFPNHGFPYYLARPAETANGVDSAEENGQDSENIDAAASVRESLKKLDDHIEDFEGVKEGLEELQGEFDDFSGDKSIAHSGTSNSTMRVIGRLHADAWAFPENDAAIDTLEGGPAGPQSRFQFRRMRFGVGGDLPGNMIYRIEMEFAGGNNAEFRDAFLGWEDLPFLQKLRIGNQKRPYGLDHLNSSRYNVFLERPFIIEAFNQDSRRLGIVSYGVSDNQRWNWRNGIYNLRLIQDEGNYTNDNLQLEYASRLANTFWWDEVSEGRGYAHWAISHSYASPDGNTPTNNGGTGPDVNETRFRHRPEARSATRWIDTGVIAGTDDYHLVGLENVWNFGPLQLVGEYQNIWLNRDAGAGPDLFLWGGYVYASYFLTGEHMPWSRSSGTLGRIKPFEDFFLVKKCGGGVGRGLGAWQVAARYSYADLNDGDIFGGVGESFTMGLNWYWTQNARLQFNWIHGSIRDNRVTRGASLSGDYDIVGTRLMVDF